MPDTLNYSTQRKRLSLFRPTKTKVLFLCILFAVGLFLFQDSLLTSADIRIDTGDLRYRYLGIPLVYRRMPEPERSLILKLGNGSTILRPEWRTCRVYPGGRNNTDLMCLDFYAEVNVWGKEDPHLARLMVEDIANYITAAHATQGLPACAEALSLATWQPNGQFGIAPGWQRDEAVIAYANSKGYTLPTTTPSP
jgi:hypothetical protein